MRRMREDGILAGLTAQRQFSPRAVTGTAGEKRSFTLMLGVCAKRRQNQRLNCRPASHGCVEAIGINLPNALLARVRKVVSEATCPSVRAYRLELNMA